MLRTTFALLLIATGLTVGTGCEALNNAQTEQVNPSDTPPNIVLIISDDQAWNHYAFMGHDTIQTPRLDQLAKQSVLFRRGYVPTGLCRPSLMTMITGQYASVHGITGNDPSPKYAKRGSELYKQRRAKLIANIDRFETLPEALCKKGYLSHQSGKWWEGNYKRGGFTHGMTRGFPQPGGRHGDDGLKIGRQGMSEVTDFIDMAIDKKKPFFVWYAPFLPHSPHTPPQRLLDKYAKPGVPMPVAKYRAMCEWFDETCGTLIDHIDNKDIRKNTLIIYVTDNGWIQNPKQANRYAPRSKQTAYEGGVRTPIMYSWLGKFKHEERKELATSLDIYPTILAAAGIKPDPQLPGLNLYDEMTTGNKIDRNAIFGESFAHDIADLDKPEATLLYRWVIEGDYKLLLSYDGEVNRYTSTHMREEGGIQLFNLTKDPHETKNIAKDHPKLVARLSEKITDWYPVKERKILPKKY